jgi:hypothetical protein
VKTNDMYEELSKEWQMTSEEIQNAIYKEWHKKYHQASSAKLPGRKSSSVKLDNG